MRQNRALRVKFPTIFFGLIEEINKLVGFRVVSTKIIIHL